MKDVLSAFNTDVLRPVVTMLVPGAVAVSTWTIAALQAFPWLQRLAKENHVDFVMALFIMVLFVSMMVENLGLWFESHCLDKLRNKQTNGDFLQDWNEYLLIAYNPNAEPVARRYLRSLLQHLKFELNAGMALLVAIPGMRFVQMPTWWRAGCVIFCAITALYLLLWEAQQTHKSMGEVRHSLLRGHIRVVQETGTAQPM